MASRPAAARRRSATKRGKGAKKQKRGIAAKQAKALPVTAPVALGQGYSLFTGDGLNTAVAGSSRTISGDAAVSCRICDSTESFLGVLDVSASAAAGVSGIASVDAKLDLMYSLQLTSHSVTIVVHCKHITGTSSYTDTRLTPPAPGHDDDVALRDFFAAYGDTYVSEITEGGEYLAVYAFYSESRDDQLDVMASLNASGIIDGMPVEGGLQAKISMAMKSSETRINFKQRVLGLKKVSLPRPDDIVDFALRFADLEKDAPVTLAIKVRGYEHVPGMTHNFETIETNRTAMLQLREKSGKVQRLINQIDGVLSIYDYYGGFDDTKLKDTRKKAEQDLVTIRNRIAGYLRNPVESTSDAARLSLPSLNVGIPVIDYDIETGFMGASGGQLPTKDVQASTVVSQRLSIKRLQFKASKSSVNKMEVTYESEDVGIATVEVGDGNGGSSEKRDFAAREKITSMIGTYKDGVITNLRINTTKGNIRVAKDGRGEPTGWEVPKGYFAVALQGKGDHKGVHSLTLTAAKFKPANWVPSV